MNPKRIIGYFSRNMLGDLDAVIASAPGAVKFIPHAITELRKYHGPNVALSGNLRKARDLAVLGSSMTPQDIPDVKSLRLLQRFYLSEDRDQKNFIGKWFEWAREKNEFRENALRYAAFLYYQKKIEDDALLHYGGANRAVVEEIRRSLGDDVAAAHLARNLLGDYGNISEAGEWLRKYLLPFWSWNEINFRRYPRFVVNALQSGNKKDAGRAAAVYSAVAVARIAGLYAIVTVFNHLFWPDEEDELTADEKASPHLILGRRSDGSIIVLRNISALGDLLEWTGLPAIAELFPAYLNDQVTFADMAKEGVKSPINKAVSGVNPFYRAVPEVLGGQSYFPDVFEPRSVPRAEAAANVVGLRDELRYAEGLILQDGSTARSGWLARFIGVSDPRKNSLHAIFDARDRFLVKQGKDTTGSFAKSKIATMRQAGEAEDYENFVKARKKYLSTGGDFSRFCQSLSSLDPLSRIANKDEQAFREFLTPAQRGKLDEARTYSKELELRLFAWWQVAAAESGDEAQQADLEETLGKKLLSHARTLARTRPFSKTDRERVAAEQETAKNWLRERQIDPADVLAAYRRLHSSTLKDRDAAHAGEMRLRTALRGLSGATKRSLPAAVGR
ncbi:MAG: hypothetical protein WBC44_01445 [Planctomycetaceae bacterium]